jgi:hypothetical protein
VRAAARVVLAPVRRCRARSVASWWWRNGAVVEW